MSPCLPVEAFHPLLPGQIDLLRALVESESPTTDKQAVDRLGRFVAEEMKRLGARVNHFPQTSVGDHWLGTWGGSAGGVLLLTHLDTVYPPGTIDKMPWRTEGGRAYGPGALDMKAGVAIALTAIRALMESGSLRAERVSLLCTSDEETGSATSRALIERLAQEHRLTLCLEPALADGGLKTRRKGIGEFTIEVHGRAAHAGVDPTSGVNAILEMTHVLQQAAALADEGAGDSVNVGLIEGGTRPNVVPETCRANLDVRTWTPAGQQRLETALGSLTPANSGAQVVVRGGWRRPAMDRTPAIAAAFARAQAVGRELGLELSEGSTGGGSDANFVAALGMPVLDGLGTVGNGAHSVREHVDLESLPQRTALLAALINEG
jgi:glutamate carboxypeptidase